MTASSVDGNVFDVVVIGGGPAGSTVATLLTQGGLRVGVFERESFPRFHIGESLLPANLRIFDRMGCHNAIRQEGFLVKPGATFYDEHEGRGPHTFTFQPTPFQPTFAYHVVRAEFDALLLQHAADVGVAVHRQHDVKQVQFATDRVTVQVREPHGTQRQVQASLLVDASGRSAFVGSHLGQKEQIPDLGKVAIFAHYKGVHRDPSIPDGNIRILLVPDGWMWWIPFANGTDSIGCVLHARVVKARSGSVEALFENVLASSPRITHGLAEAQRITPIHTAANFAYRVSPLIGERYLAVGDAAGFVDPIFSAGVFLAMRSAEMAADSILAAFGRQDFSVARFRAYEAQLHRGIAPYLAMIRHFYEPAFLDLFFSARPPAPLFRSVLWVLSGAAFDQRSFWLRGNLRLFFAFVAIRGLIRRATGLPAESRWRW
jgi:flavin-dependent dehydrogenase